jgi:acyl carrier protein
MDLADEVRDVLRKELNLQDLQPDKLQPGTPLFGPDGVGLDSIDALELVVILKRNFGATIADRKDGERAFQTFGSLVEFIRGARKTKT